MSESGMQTNIPMLSFRGSNFARNCARRDVPLDVVVRDRAADDIRSAHQWYRDNAPGQELRFLTELDNCLSHLAAHPRVPAPGLHNVRQMSLNVFPYRVWYRVNDVHAVIEVIALVHHRQDPAGFQRR